MTNIVSNPDILCGKPVIRGTRLSVEFITQLLASGWTADAIASEYPGVTLEDVRQCVEFDARRG